MSKFKVGEVVRLKSGGPPDDPRKLSPKIDRGGLPCPPGWIDWPQTVALAAAMAVTVGVVYLLAAVRG